MCEFRKVYKTLDIKRGDQTYLYSKTCLLSNKFEKEYSILVHNYCHFSIYQNSRLQIRDKPMISTHRIETGRVYRSTSNDTNIIWQ